MNKKYIVRSASREYPITWYSSLSELVAAVSAQVRPGDMLLVDSNADKYYGKHFRSLFAPGKVFVIPSGEKSKSFHQYEKLTRALIRSGANRKTTLFALGGGVTGDLSGYIASTLLRGVSFVQIPTTLLSMVDSSVGGKTGINVPEGKNLVGTFYQPLSVHISMEFLQTLPAGHITGGFAEIIKSALLRDKKLLREIQKAKDAIRKRDPEILRKLSEKAVTIKADVVSEDETETGVRATLNLGHTLAHALEAFSRYKGITHGEAVAIGMHFAVRLSASLGILAIKKANEIIEIFRETGLPLYLQEYSVLKKASPEKLVALMKRDKKNISEDIRFILLDEPGNALLPQPVPDTTLLTELTKFIEEGNK